MNSTVHNRKSIRTYVFRLLQSHNKPIRFVFKIGNNTADSQICNREGNNIHLQPMTLQAELIYDLDNKIFESLRALIKVFSIGQKQQMQGLVDLFLNQYVESPNHEIIHEKQLKNSQDHGAQIRFRIKPEQVIQQILPMVKRNQYQFLTDQVQNSDKRECQISILQQSMSNKAQIENLDNLNAFIQQLKNKIFLLQTQSIQNSKLIKRFQNKEEILKRSLKQLQQNFQKLKQELNEKELAYQGLITTINNSQNPDIQQVQQFILCKKCEILRGEIAQKEKNYEQQLGICQGLIKGRDDEINRLHMRIDTLEKRSEVTKYKYKQCQSYQILIADIFQSLRDKANEMQINIPELGLPDQLLKVPQNLPSIFSNLLGRLQPHIGIVINGIQQQTEKGEKYHYWEELKQKSGIISDLQFDLQKAIQRINQLQTEANNYKQQRQSLLSMGTAKFGQISFGKKQSLFRRDSDLQDLIARESHRVQQQIDFLKKRNSELEELMNQQERLLQSLTLENTIKSKELQLRMDLQKKIQRSIQNEVDLEKQLNYKDSEIQNLKRTIQQYQEDVQQLKEKLTLEPINSRKKSSKNKIDARIQSQSLQNDIKDLLESLDKQENEEEQLQWEQGVQTQTNQKCKQINHEVKSTIQKKLKSLSLQFLRMKSLKVSRCKSKQQTQQLMADFMNFRNKLQDVMGFIDNI